MFRHSLSASTCLMLFVLLVPQPFGGALRANAGVADAVLAAQIGHRNPGLVLLQDPGDLLFGKPIALHALVLVVGQSELQTGLSPWG